ncbi:MAG TPA: hypothetical protein VEK38_02275 [Candidatus Bathyarchaeia archaeon]|nr:hypothetical protein [Candidatus Bathyarchaeia archaeon]
MHQSYSSLVYIFVQFLRRDMRVYAAKISENLINYALIIPLLNGISFAYLQSHIYFGTNSAQGLAVFCGTILGPFLALIFKVAFDILFDLEGNRFIDYQLVILNPRLILLQRILFITLYSFCMMLPFFPMVYIALGSYVDMSSSSWFLLAPVIFCASFCITGYTMLFAVILRRYQIRMFWTRVNHILMIFGGMFIPYHTIAQFSPLLGMIVRANPLIYASEGIRAAIVGGPLFMSIATCCIMLILFGTIFTLLTFYFFKKRVDHL